MGPIDGQWIAAEQKEEILTVIASAKDRGVPVQRTCTILGISRRRVVRWRGLVREEISLENQKPGPVKPLHRLLPEETQQVVEFAKQEEYVDLSHRCLTIKAWELQLFFVSFSSVYRILRSEGLMSQRGCHRQHNRNSIPPVRRELAGPNQRWCWDISYLYTFEKGIFLYLYLLIDEYSRKALSWEISWQQTAQVAKRFLDEAMTAESILDLPEEERPELFNDRGRQMKAKPVRNLLADHGMPQLFSRPRTPNDNPFIESAFSAVKRFPEYPGRFLDREEAQNYFTNYFNWYNFEHYHSGIDYVTPHQAHTGQREKIVAERQRKLYQQRQWRKERNRVLNTVHDSFKPQLPSFSFNQSEPIRSVIAL